MSKNFIIAVLLGMLAISMFTKSCNNNAQQSNRLEDSLGIELMLKRDSINDLQLQLNNIDTAFSILKKQRQKIKYETKFIWKTKDSVNSIIYNDSDTETVRKFIERYNTY
jgi:hypothetical protein